MLHVLEKIKGWGQAMTAKLLSYWTNIDYNTTLEERDPHVTHSDCQNLNIQSE